MSALDLEDRLDAALKAGELEDARASVRMLGYKPLERGAVVTFMRGKGLMRRQVRGTVVGHELDPNRKPGRSRVRYQISLGLQYESVWIWAATVEPVGGAK